MVGPTVDWRFTWCKYKGLSVSACAKPSWTPIFAAERRVLFGNRGVLKATRTQIPLRPAYAATIHHFQGTSLYHPRNIHIQKPFCPPGMMYVALSRFVDPNMINLVCFDESMIAVDKQV